MIDLQKMLSDRLSELSRSPQRCHGTRQGIKYSPEWICHSWDRILNRIAKAFRNSDRLWLVTDIDGTCINARYRTTSTIYAWLSSEVLQNPKDPELVSFLSQILNLDVFDVASAWDPTDLSMRLPLGYPLRWDVHLKRGRDYHQSRDFGFFASNRLETDLPIPGMPDLFDAFRECGVRIIAVTLRDLREEGALFSGEQLGPNFFLLNDLNCCRTGRRLLELGLLKPDDQLVTYAGETVLNFSTEAIGHVSEPRKLEPIKHLSYRYGRPILYLDNDPRQLFDSELFVGKDGLVLIMGDLPPGADKLNCNNLSVLYPCDLTDLSKKIKELNRRYASW